MGNIRDFTKSRIKGFDQGKIATYRHVRKSRHPSWVPAKGHLEYSSGRRMKAQPPEPGLPMQKPSVMRVPCSIVSPLTLSF